MKQAPAGDVEFIRSGAVLYPQRDIQSHFTVQPLSNLSTGQILSFPAAEGRIVDPERHVQGWFVHRHPVQRLFLPRGTDGVSDLDGIDAFDGHQIPCFHHFGFGLAQPGKAERFQNPTFFDAIGGTDRNIRPRLHHPAFDSPDRNPPGVLRPVQVGHQQLQWSLGITSWRGHAIKDLVQQRNHTTLIVFGGISRPPISTRRVEHGEVECLIVGPQRHQQIKDFIEDPIGISIRAIALVDDHHQTQTEPQSLLQDEAGLGHRSFMGIHQEEGTIRHTKHPFHLTAEVGVTWGIQNVDPDGLAGVRPGLGDVVHGTIFGQNGDSAFTLQRVGIHDAGGVLGGPDPSLGQNRIHQGGLAMIDVCDDGHITEGTFHESSHPTPHPG